MSPRAFRNRCALVGAFALAAVIGAFLAPRWPQDPAYHAFADRRPFLGIPNFGDVISNLPFCIVGALALLWLSARDRRVGPGRPFLTRIEWWAWTVTFVGVFFTGIGSAYYHWAPDTLTLFWDRLPMTVAFMGLFGTQIMERISVRAGSMLIVPLLVVGVSSVVSWRMGEGAGTGDLRLYAIVQFYPIIAIPLLFLLFPARYDRTFDLVLTLVWYGAAKAGEALDVRIFHGLGGAVSGHTLKHLCAGAGMAQLLWMLKRRRPLVTPSPPASEASRS